MSHDQFNQLRLTKGKCRGHSMSNEPKNWKVKPPS